MTTQAHIWFIENLGTATGVGDRWVVVCGSEQEAIAMLRVYEAFKVLGGRRGIKEIVETALEAARDGSKA